MKPTRFVNCIAIDDAPFPRNFKGDVKIVATVFASLRLDGILIGKIRKDGINSTKNIISLIKNSKFFDHSNVILLQGIAFGGFNVVDAPKLYKALNKPVLIVARDFPNYRAIKETLLQKVPGGKKKWKLIETLGPMERCYRCYIQRVGLSYDEAYKIIKYFTIYGNIPEPLRTAHLIASTFKDGISRGRA